MPVKESISIMTLYAVSPIHAGCGASTAAVDLPIQRERHTQWPHIQASAVKGGLRAHYRDTAQDKALVNLIFGTDEGNDGNHFEAKGIKKGDIVPGALSVSDARLAAFPMRSNIAPFVWVTCPAVLKRLGVDLEIAGIAEKAGLDQKADGDKALCVKGGITGQVVLEDLVVTVSAGVDIPVMTGKLFPQLERLLIISDQMYQYCVTSCTEIQTQIKIDSEKGTAKDGALRYQELLPADSAMYTLLAYSGSAFDNSLQADSVKKHVSDSLKGFVQLGGDWSLGRGIFSTGIIPDVGGGK